MNWKLKAHGLAVLSRMPGGKSLYHGLQKWMGTNKLDAGEYTQRAIEIPELIRQCSKNPCGGTYLEIGTGWRPFLPFLLYLIGARKIITLDVNPWLSNAYVAETYRALAGQLPEIASRLGLLDDELRERYQAGMPHADDMHALLRACNIIYKYPADATQTGLPNQSVDFVVSSNVLEHVAPEVLQALHRESLRILAPDGTIVHRFNPEDHFKDVDKSITAANFLQYSPGQWFWYGGSGLAYHNRLRCVQHRALLEEAGLSVRVARIRTDARSLQAIKNGELSVHSDFSHFSPEELAADYMWVAATRPEEHVPAANKPVPNPCLTGAEGPTGVRPDFSASQTSISQNT